MAEKHEVTQVTHSNDGCDQVATSYYLAIEFVFRHVGFHKIVGSPLQGVKDVLQLSNMLVHIPIFYNAPS